MIVCTSALRRLKVAQAVFSQFSRNAATVSDASEVGRPTESSISSNVKILPQNFPPFVKDLFAGHFNKSVLSFAEVLNYERYFKLESTISELREYLSSKHDSLSQVSRTGKVPEDVLFSLRQRGLYGMNIPFHYGGQDLMYSEIAAIFAELGAVDMSLSEMLNIHLCLGCRAIVLHGTSEQKQEYLPSMAAGENLATFCLTESACGSDPNSARMTADWDETLDAYVLNGTKTWVANARSARTLLVFAQTQEQDYLGQNVEDLTAFIVDKDAVDGLDVSINYDSSGYKGLELASVTFKDTKVPPSAILGEKGKGVVVLSSILHHNKFMIGAAVAANLRELLTETILYTQSRRQYGKPLAEFELIRLQLAKMAEKLYALESMVYMTAGLADASEQPDIEVESVLTKQYATETSEYIVNTCLDILGANATLESGPYLKYVRDNQALRLWQGSSNILKCFAAVSGILHMRETEKLQELMKIRNPVLHPYKSFKHQWDSMKLRDDKNFIKTPLKLINNVHPVMEQSAENLEYCFHKMNWVVSEVIIQEGNNIQISEGMLEKLSDIAMEVFAMTCVVSRASRSYVVGHLHAEHEVNMAKPYIHDARARVISLIKSVEPINRGNREGNYDEFHLRTGDYLTRKGGYVAVSPLTKNSY